MPDKRPKQNEKKREKIERKTIQLNADLHIESQRILKRARERVIERWRERRDCSAQSSKPNDFLKRQYIYAKAIWCTHLNALQRLTPLAHNCATHRYDNANIARFSVHYFRCRHKVISILLFSLASLPLFSLLSHLSFFISPTFFFSLLFPCVFLLKYIKCFKFFLFLQQYQQYGNLFSLGR